MSGIPLRPDEAERKQEVESEMQRRGRENWPGNVVH